MSHGQLLDQIFLFKVLFLIDIMPGPQNDVIELMEEEDEVASDDARMNRDLFKDQHGFPIGFFLHKSIKKGFSRRNLSRDIKVRYEPEV